MTSLGIRKMSKGGSEDSSDEDEVFSNMGKDGAEIAQIYYNLYQQKAAPRTSQLSGMGWLNETLKTPGECHNMLRMNQTIFMDFHDALVERQVLCRRCRLSKLAWVPRFI